MEKGGIRGSCIVLINCGVKSLAKGLTVGKTPVGPKFSFLT